jgi:hypothetical protein
MGLGEFVKSDQIYLIIDINYNIYISTHILSLIMFITIISYIYSFKSHHI